MNQVTVIGSINLDRTLRVPQMAQLGATMHVKEVFTAGGGKGANQAIAASRLGATTHFIGAVGEDQEVSKMMLTLLEEADIDCTGIAQLPNQNTGQAFVIVTDSGDNMIYVHGGANMAFKPDHVTAHAEMLAASDFVVAQFETPFDCTAEAFRIARAHHRGTILNPAPAITDVPDDLLALTDIIVPNETEAEILTGIPVTDEDSMAQVAAKLHARGVATVLLPWGAGERFIAPRRPVVSFPLSRLRPLTRRPRGTPSLGPSAVCCTPTRITWSRQLSSVTGRRQLPCSGLAPSRRFRISGRCNLTINNPQRSFS